MQMPRGNDAAWKSQKEKEAVGMIGGHVPVVLVEPVARARHEGVGGVGLALTLRQTVGKRCNICAIRIAWSSHFGPHSLRLVRGVVCCGIVHNRHGWKNIHSTHVKTSKRTWEQQHWLPRGTAIRRGRG